MHLFKANSWKAASSTSHPPRTSTAPYTYLHCYQDDSARVLSGNFSTSSAQTVDVCLDKCAGGGYAYAGLEDGTECHCTNSLRSNAIQAPEGDCAVPCAGDCEVLGTFFIIVLDLFGSRTYVWWSMAAQCIYKHGIHNNLCAKTNLDSIVLDPLWMCCRRYHWFSSGADSGTLQPSRHDAPAMPKLVL